ncbi:MAG: flagellar hook-basal body protein [Polyangiaceae bacterium]
MSHGIWAAASGATAQITMVDVIANNAANAMTPGFRADQALFREVLDRAQVGKPNASVRMTRVDGVRPDMEVGQLKYTGKPLDVSINGKGFFAVRTATGEMYTRAGNLKIDASGQIVSARGDAFLSTTRQPLRVDPDATDVRVGKDGSILVNGEDSGQRLLVVDLEQTQGLMKEGDSYLRIEGGARPAGIDANLEPESLELSNAPPVKSMTGLVTATRHFDMMDRVIQAFSEIDRKAAEEIARR